MNEAERNEEAVFQAALQLPADQRGGYLDQACAGDADLRRRVEVLLDAFERAGGFMQEPAAPTPLRPAPSDLPPAEKPGDRIGRYKLLEKIGEGGMGVVYMAEQTEPVVRKVAFKIIKLGMDTRRVVARFEAERQALALMDHPNIAQVLDGGVTESGRPYFVMDLVQGLPITQFCDEGNLPTVERIRLFLDVCSALQHAHQKGIIHRDLKSSNILVTLYGDRPVPKIIDFGVAKATQGRLTDKTVFTQFQHFIGTPAYMSPEQTSLSGWDVDTRSDIYALGVLLYELLTGTTPFDAKELLQAGLDSIRQIIREREPPKPSTRLSTMQGRNLAATAKHRHTEPPKLIHAVRGDLDWIVMKCLEKDRARRYETANGLAADLRRHLNSEPVVARPPSRLYEFQKAVRRHKFGFGAAAALIFVLAGGVLVSTFESVRATRAEHVAVKALAQAQANEQKAQTEAASKAQVAQFLKAMLEGVGPSVARGRDTTLLKEILDKTVERIDKDLKDQPEIQAELRNTLGEVYRALNELKRAEEMHRRALGLRRKVFGQEHLDVAASLNNLANVLNAQGRLAEAETMHRDALAMRRKLLGDEHPDVAASLNNVANVLENQGRLAEAESIHRDVLAMKKKLLGNEHLDVAASLNNLANVLTAQGRAAEAESFARDALEMRKRLLGEEHPDVAASLNNLGNVLNAEGKLTEAEAMHRAALTMYRKLLGNDHSDVAASLNNLGNVLENQGKLAEAEAVHRGALALKRRLLGNVHRDVAASLNNLANVLNAEGKRVEAESFARDALAMRQQLLGDEHPDVAASFNNLGMVLQGRGKVAEARSAYQKAAERNNLEALNNLAWLLATCEDPTIRDGSAAVGFAEKAVAATNRKTANYLDSLAAAYAEAGQFEKAVSVQQEAIALLRNENQKNDFRSRLKLYQSNTPYREPVPTQP